WWSGLHRLRLAYDTRVSRFLRRIFGGLGGGFLLVRTLYFGSCWMLTSWSQTRRGLAAFTLEIFSHLRQRGLIHSLVVLLRVFLS
uniref:Uncharacterized protein n=1 Tax=Anopheles dirus TaxID=7168 RepID=A0A182NVY6_9DIPT